MKAPRPKRSPIASCSERWIAALRPMMQPIAPMKATMPHPRETSRPRYAPSAATAHVSATRPIVWPKIARERSRVTATDGWVTCSRLLMTESYWLDGRSGGAALRQRAVLLGERDHEPAEELVQLILLRLRQRGCDGRLLLGLDGDALLPEIAAVIGELDHDATTIVRVRQPADQVCLFHLVEPRRH